MKQTRHRRPLQPQRCHLLSYPEVNLILAQHQEILPKPTKVGRIDLGEELDFVAKKMTYFSSFHWKGEGCSDTLQICTTYVIIFQGNSKTKFVSHVVASRS